MNVINITASLIDGEGEIYNKFKEVIALAEKENREIICKIDSSDVYV